jgi:hypothetical protein
MNVYLEGEKPIPAINGKQGIGSANSAKRFLLFRLFSRKRFLLAAIHLNPPAVGCSLD